VKAEKLSQVHNVEMQINRREEKMGKKSNKINVLFEKKRSGNVNELPSLNRDFTRRLRLAFEEELSQPLVSQLLEKFLDNLNKLIREIEKIENVYWKTKAVELFSRFMETIYTTRNLEPAVKHLEDILHEFAGIFEDQAMVKRLGDITRLLAGVPRKKAVKSPPANDRKFSPIRKKRGGCNGSSSGGGGGTGGGTGGGSSATRSVDGGGDDVGGPVETKTIDNFRIDKIEDIIIDKNRKIMGQPPTTKQTIERYPDVSLRDKVQLNKKCTLRVAVTQFPARDELKEKRMIFTLPPEVKKIEVEVLITAEDFEIEGDNFQPLNVPVDKDSEPILFQMIPKSTGEKKVKVEFFQNSRYIGGVTVTTQVVVPSETTGAKQISTQGVFELKKEVTSPDLTILITESKSNDEKMRYNFKLLSPKNELFYYNVREELRFTGSPSQWIEGLYKELGTLHEKESAGDIKETLDAIGTDLYEKLFPKELKTIWEEKIKDRVKSIMIISDEPWIPWEIVKPCYVDDRGVNKEDDFLCESYQLTRWISGGPSPPSLIEISRGALIVPVMSKLPNVKKESEFLKKILKHLKPIVPSSLSNVRELLRNGGYQLIHFACHGSFNPKDHEKSIVYLEGNDKLKPRDIAGERKNFGRDKPFVFINACQTTRADFSLVGIGSWADKFVNAKSSVFLGASWEVNDEKACCFTEAFYDNLCKGMTIGEAMKEARTKIKEEIDPTWLAYTLYADPLAKVVFSEPEMLESPSDVKLLS
jgi:hypothetical protein